MAVSNPKFDPQALVDEIAQEQAAKKGPKAPQVPFGPPAPELPPVTSAPETFRPPGKFEVPSFDPQAVIDEIAQEQQAQTTTRQPAPRPEPAAAGFGGLHAYEQAVEAGQKPPPPYLEMAPQPAHRPPVPGTIPFPTDFNRPQAMQDEYRRIEQQRSALADSRRQLEADGRVLDKEIKRYNANPRAVDPEHRRRLQERIVQHNAYASQHDFALSELQDSYQRYTQMELDAHQLPTIEPVGYEPSPQELRFTNAQARLKELPAFAQRPGFVPADNGPLRPLFQARDDAALALANSWPQLVKEFQTRGQQLQRQAAKLTDLTKRINAHQVPPGADRQRHELALRYNQNQKNQKERYQQLQTLAAAIQAAFKGREGTGPKPIGFLSDPETQERADATQWNQFWRSVGNTPGIRQFLQGSVQHQKAAMARQEAILARMMANGEVPRLPYLSQDQRVRERQQAETEAVRQLVKEDHYAPLTTLGQPLVPGTRISTASRIGEAWGRLTPFQRTLVPILQQQYDALDRANVEAETTKAVVTDVAAGAAAWEAGALVGGLGAGLVTRGLARYLAPTLEGALITGGLRGLAAHVGARVGAGVAGGYVGGGAAGSTAALISGLAYTPKPKNLKDALNNLKDVGSQAAQQFAPAANLGAAFGGAAAIFDVGMSSLANGWNAHRSPEIVRQTVEYTRAHYGLDAAQGEALAADLERFAKAPIRQKGAIRDRINRSLSTARVRYAAQQSALGQFNVGRSTFTQPLPEGFIASPPVEPAPKPGLRQRLREGQQRIAAEAQEPTLERGYSRADILAGAAKGRPIPPPRPPTPAADPGPPPVDTPGPQVRMPDGQVHNLRQMSLAELDQAIAGLDQQRAATEQAMLAAGQQIVPGYEPLGIQQIDAAKAQLSQWRQLHVDRQIPTTYPDGTPVLDQQSAARYEAAWKASNPYRAHHDALKAYAEKVRAGDPKLAALLDQSAAEWQRQFAWNYHKLNAPTELGGGRQLSLTGGTPPQVSTWRQLSVAQRAALPPRVQQALLFEDLTNSAQVLDNGAGAISGRKGGEAGTGRGRRLADLEAAADQQFKAAQTALTPPEEAARALEMGQAPVQPGLEGRAAGAFGRGVRGPATGYQLPTGEVRPAPRLATEGGQRAAGMEFGQNVQRPTPPRLPGEPLDVTPGMALGSVHTLSDGAEVRVIGPETHGMTPVEVINPNSSGRRPGEAFATSELTAPPSVEDLGWQATGGLRPPGPPREPPPPPPRTGEPIAPAGSRFEDIGQFGGLYETPPERPGAPAPIRGAQVFTEPPPPPRTPPEGVAPNVEMGQRVQEGLAEEPGATGVGARRRAVAGPPEPPRRPARGGVQTEAATEVQPEAIDQAALAQAEAQLRPTVTADIRRGTNVILPGAAAVMRIDGPVRMGPQRGKFQLTVTEGDATHQKGQKLYVTKDQLLQSQTAPPGYGAPQVSAPAAGTAARGGAGQKQAAAPGAVGTKPTVGAGTTTGAGQAQAGTAGAGTTTQQERKERLEQPTQTAVVARGVTPEEAREGLRPTLRYRTEAGDLFELRRITGGQRAGEWTLKVIDSPTKTIGETTYTNTPAQLIQQKGVTVVPEGESGLPTFHEGETRKVTRTGNEFVVEAEVTSGKNAGTYRVRFTGAKGKGAIFWFTPGEIERETEAVSAAPLRAAIGAPGSKAVASQMTPGLRLVDPQEIGWEFKRMETIGGVEHFVLAATEDNEEFGVTKGEEHPVDQADLENNFVLGVQPRPAGGVQPAAAKPAEKKVVFTPRQAVVEDVSRGASFHNRENDLKIKFRGTQKNGDARFVITHLGQVEEGPGFRKGATFDIAKAKLHEFLGNFNVIEPGVGDALHEAILAGREPTEEEKHSAAIDEAYRAVKAAERAGDQEALQAANARLHELRQQAQERTQAKQEAREAERAAAEAEAKPQELTPEQLAAREQVSQIMAKVLDAEKRGDVAEYRRLADESNALKEKLNPIFGPHQQFHPMPERFIEANIEKMRTGVFPAQFVHERAEEGRQREAASIFDKEGLRRRIGEKYYDALPEELIDKAIARYQELTARAEAIFGVPLNALTQHQHGTAGSELAKLNPLALLERLGRQAYSTKRGHKKAPSPEQLLQTFKDYEARLNEDISRFKVPETKIEALAIQPTNKALHFTRAFSPEERQLFDELAQKGIIQRTGPSDYKHNGFLWQWVTGSEEKRREIEADIAAHKQLFPERYAEPEKTVAEPAAEAATKEVGQAAPEQTAAQRFERLPHPQTQDLQPGAQLINATGTEIEIVSRKYINNRTHAFIVKTLQSGTAPIRREKGIVVEGVPKVGQTFQIGPGLLKSDWRVVQHASEFTLAPIGRDDELVGKTVRHRNTGTVYTVTDKAPVTQGNRVLEPVGRGLSKEFAESRIRQQFDFVTGKRQPGPVETVEPRPGETPGQAAARVTTGPSTATGSVGQVVGITNIARGAVLKSDKTGEVVRVVGRDPETRQWNVEIVTPGTYRRQPTGTVGEVQSRDPSDLYRYLVVEPATPAAIEDARRERQAYAEANKDIKPHEIVAMTGGKIQLPEAEQIAARFKEERLAEEAAKAAPPQATGPEAGAQTPAEAEALAVTQLKETMAELAGGPASMASVQQIITRFEKLETIPEDNGIWRLLVDAINKEQPNSISPTAGSTLKQAEHAEGKMKAGPKKDTLRRAIGQARTLSHVFWLARKPFALGSKGKVHVQVQIEGATGDVEFRWAIMDVDQVITSHDPQTFAENPEFPQQLQPRDRSSTQLKDQIVAWTTPGKDQLKPELLGENPLAGHGAPIVNELGQVEVGNGRSIALVRAYDQGSPVWMDYQKWLRESGVLQRNGIGITALDKASVPMLVRLRTQKMTPEQQREFVKAANNPEQAAMDAVETARADVDAITPEMLALFNPTEDGDLTTATNRPFVDKFIQSLPISQRQGIIENNKLTPAGLTRLRNAVFQKVYGNPEALERLAMSTENNIRRISNAMLQTVGAMARHQELIRKGEVAPRDLAPYLADAANIFSRLRAKGGSLEAEVENWLTPTLDPEHQPSPTTQALVQVLWEYRNSQKKIARFITNYLNLAERLAGPNAPTASMFGEEAGMPSIETIIGAAAERTDAVTDEGQEGLFRAVPRQQGRKGGEFEQVPYIGEPWGQHLASSNIETHFSPRGTSLIKPKDMYLPPSVMTYLDRFHPLINKVVRHIAKQVGLEQRVAHVSFLFLPSENYRLYGMWSPVGSNQAQISINPFPGERILEHGPHWSHAGADTDVPQELAEFLVTTAIHELAHFNEEGEDLAHWTEMDRIYQSVPENEMWAMVDALREVLTDPKYPGLTSPDYQMAVIEANTSMEAYRQLVGSDLDYRELGFMGSTGKRARALPRSRQQLLPWEMTRKEFMATGRELLHGTSRDFAKFDPEAQTNKFIRSGGHWFTLDPAVAQTFAFEGGARSAVNRETWFRNWGRAIHDPAILDALTEEDSDHELTVDMMQRMALSYLKRGNPVYYTDYDGKWVPLTDPAQVKEIDDTETGFVAYPKKHQPRVIQTTVYGHELDLRDARNWPARLVEALKESNKVWDQRLYERYLDALGYYGARGKTELYQPYMEIAASPTLQAYAKANGIGKIRTKDAYESGFDSFYVPDVAYTDYGQNPHQAMVESALANGIEVPARVLSDYPHLMHRKRGEHGVSTAGLREHGPTTAQGTGRGGRQGLSAEQLSHPGAGTTARNEPAGIRAGQGRAGSHLAETGVRTTPQRLHHQAGELERLARLTYKQANAVDPLRLHRDLNWEQLMAAYPQEMAEEQRLRERAMGLEADSLQLRLGAYELEGGEGRLSVKQQFMSQMHGPERFNFAKTLFGEMNREALSGAKTGEPLTVIGFRAEPRGGTRNRVPNTGVFYAPHPELAADYSIFGKRGHQKIGDTESEHRLMRRRGGYKDALTVDLLKFNNPLVFRGGYGEWTDAAERLNYWTRRAAERGVSPDELLPEEGARFPIQLTDREIKLLQAARKIRDVHRKWMALDRAWAQIARQHGFDGIVKLHWNEATSVIERSEVVDLGAVPHLTAPRSLEGRKGGERREPRFSYVERKIEPIPEKQTPKRGQMPFTDPLLQQQTAQAFGTQAISLLENAQAFVTEIGHLMTRELQHLPRGATKLRDPFQPGRTIPMNYIVMRQRINQLAKGVGIASLRAVLTVARVLKGLSEEQQALFNAQLILADLAEEIAYQREQIRLGFAERGIEPSQERIDAKLELPKLVNADGTLTEVWTPEKVADEAEHIGNLVAQDEQVQHALRLREAAQESVANELLDAMEDVFGKRKDLPRRAYYRHMILEYNKATKRIAGVPMAAASVKQPFQEYFKRRIGSPLPYNTDFIQAETEWMAQALYDIAVYKVIKEAEVYDIAPNILARINSDISTALTPYFEAQAAAENAAPGKGPNARAVTAEDMRRRILNTPLARAFNKIGYMAQRGYLPHGPGGRYSGLIEELAINFQANKEERAAAAEEEREPEVIRLPDETMRELFEYLAWMLKDPGVQEGKGAAAQFFKARAYKEREKRRILTDELGLEVPTLEHVLQRPEFKGWSLWQPKKGNVMYRAWGVGDTVARQLLEQGLESVGIGKEDIHRLLVLGKATRQYVVPNELARTLDDLKESEKSPLPLQLLNYATRHWRSWVLLGPTRLVGYLGRNFSSDMMAMINVGGQWGVWSKAWHQIPRASREIAQFIKTKVPPEELANWLHQGGWHASLVGLELNHPDDIVRFAQLVERSTPQKIVHMLSHLPGAPGWFKKARLGAQFLDAVGRYGAYLYFKEQIERHPAGGVYEFGPSRMDEVLELLKRGEQDMAAYKLANDLMVAYDEISVAGRMVRDLGGIGAPFWSWAEGNARRYGGLFRNIWLMPEYEMRVAMAVAAKAARQPPPDLAPGSDDGIARDALAKRQIRLKRALSIMRHSPVALQALGKFIGAALGMEVLLHAYNQYFFPDIENALPDYERGRMHFIIPGTGGMVWTRLGAIEDALDWIGLGDIFGVAESYLNRQMDSADLIDMAFGSPVNKVIGLVGPSKLVMEAATHVSLYPDYAHPRLVRSGADVAAGSLGMQVLWDAAAWGNQQHLGDPTKRQFPFIKERHAQPHGVMAFVPQLFGARWFDYNETRYMEMVGVARKWLRKHGDKDGSPSPIDGKSNALYYFKKARAYGDDSSARILMAAYVRQGGTPEGLYASLRRLSPVYGFKPAELQRFLMEMDRVPAERKRITKPEKDVADVLAPDLESHPNQALVAVEKGVRRLLFGESLDERRMRAAMWHYLRVAGPRAYEAFVKDQKKYNEMPLSVFVPMMDQAADDGAKALSQEATAPEITKKENIQKKVLEKARKS